jgi:hypothetical protein
VLGEQNTSDGPRKPLSLEETNCCLPYHHSHSL